MLKRWKFDIFNDFSEHDTLVQFMDTTRNMNHALSISGRWIYDSNYKIPPPLMKELLGIIFSTYKYDKGMCTEY